MSERQTAPLDVALGVPDRRKVHHMTYELLSRDGGVTVVLAPAAVAA
jgi:hypothetical protein